MSTATAAPDAPPAALGEPAVPLATLVRVELRKMVDTRAGRWLLALLGVLLAVLPILFGVFGEEAEHRFGPFYRLVQLPIAVLLPVLAILSVTSEWSQRTALVTFSLVPDRRRVLAAKLVAVVVLAVAVMALGTVTAALGTLGWGGDGRWSFGVATLGETFVAQAAGMIMGLAFGLLIQASAPAIVLYFVLPTAWSILTSVVGALEGPARWLDSGRAFEPLFEGGVSATEWARAATAGALWVLVPLIAGLVRLPRSEVK
jgi:ABC-type transport system involved in multi-copper enzyme maturation permease subunit